MRSSGGQSKSEDCVESRRDNRAFLIHRPISPSRIFFAKVIAGLVLYLTTFALPLLLSVLYALAPGRIETAKVEARADKSGDREMVDITGYFTCRGKEANGKPYNGVAVNCKTICCELWAAIFNRSAGRLSASSLLTVASKHTNS